MTLCRRVVILRRTRAAVSATFITASCVQRHVRDLIAVVRIFIAVACPCLTSRRRVATPRRIRDVIVGVTRPALRSWFDSIYLYSDSGVMSAHDLSLACRHAVTHPRRRVRDVRVGVTLARQARRHVRGLVAFVRILIALSVSAHDLASACRHAPAFPRRHVRDARVGVTLSRQARRHVHDLIAFFRVMIAVSCPHLTLRGRVAML